MNLFQSASGIIQGAEHRFSNKNCQDGMCFIDRDIYMIGVVCDGCGSSPNSEIGAQIGAQLIASAIQRKLEAYRGLLYEQGGFFHQFSTKTITELFNDAFFEAVLQDTVAQIRVLAQQMHSRLSVAIRDSFLFTVVGVVVTEPCIVTFSIGDGYIIINDQITDLSISSRLEGNYPLYLAYGQLVESTAHGQSKFIVNHKVNPQDVNSIVIATDGFEYLLTATEQNKTIPGKNEIIDWKWFIENDKVFSNSSMVQRRLILINRDHKKINWEQRRVDIENGLIKDDLAMIIIRKVESEEE